MTLLLNLVTSSLKKVNFWASLSRNVLKDNLFFPRSLLIKNHLFFSSRPSTPVYNLLGHKYQDLWLEERRKAEEATRARQEQKVFLKIILPTMSIVVLQC